MSGTALPAHAVGDLAMQVRRNCDIANARHALDDPLCIYLLKMRDLFRWHHGLACTATVDKAALGQWVADQEMLWLELEDQPYQRIVIGEHSWDCFDSDGINDALDGSDLVYGAGIGLRGREVFFLAERVEQEVSGEVTITTCGRELARGVTAPPAWSRDRRVTVRRDALRHYLAGVFEEWSWNRAENVMARVMGHYGFEEDAESALDAMVEDQVEVLVLHEIGEVMAGELIGEGWQDMVASLDNPLTELKVRAVRDNLADSLACLPGLLCLERRPAIDFYYASMSALRRELFPSLLDAWENTDDGRDYAALGRVVVRGRQHWLDVSRRLLAEAGNRPPGGAGRANANIEPVLAQCAL